MTEYVSQTDTNKLIRSVLKESFPSVRFSVATRGGSTNIRWTDGPNAKQVESIISVFEGSYFDGMIDYKGSRYAWLDGKAVHFMADFIFCNRDHSQAVELRMIERLQDKYREQCDYLQKDASTIREDFHTGKLWNVYPTGGWSMDHSLQSEIHKACNKHTFYPYPKPSPTLERVQFRGDDGYGAGTVGRDGLGSGYAGYPRQ